MTINLMNIFKIEICLINEPITNTITNNTRSTQKIV